MALYLYVCRMGDGCGLLITEICPRDEVGILDIVGESGVSSNLGSRERRDYVIYIALSHVGYCDEGWESWVITRWRICFWG